MESYPAKFKSFQPKIVQMGASQELQKLQKLQNSTQSIKNSLF